MDYPAGAHRRHLPHDPFKALVAPRPIAWVSTLDAGGRPNLAPFSFFNGCGDNPPLVMLAFTGRKIGRDEMKDTLQNIRATGEFAVNIVSWELKEAMNASSGHYAVGEDEFDVAGLEKAPCVAIAPPRVARAPATMECRLHQVLELPTNDEEQPNAMAIGEVLHFHIADEFLVDGIFDITRHQPVARCGYRDYAVVREVFQMNRPGQK